MAVEALPHGQKGKTEPPGTWGHIIASNPREQAQGVGRPDEKGEEKPGGVEAWDFETNTCFQS